LRCGGGEDGREDHGFWSIYWCLGWLVGAGGAFLFFLPLEIFEESLDDAFAGLLVDFGAGSEGAEGGVDGDFFHGGERLCLWPVFG
jgi:hypothetical protein